MASSDIKRSIVMDLYDRGKSGLLFSPLTQHFRLYRNLEVLNTLVVTPTNISLLTHTNVLAKDALAPESWKKFQNAGMDESSTIVVKVKCDITDTDAKEKLLALYNIIQSNPSENAKIQIEYVFKCPTGLELEENSIEFDSLPVIENLSSISVTVLTPKLPADTGGAASSCTINGKKFTTYVKVKGEFMTVKQAQKELRMKQPKK